MRRDSPSNWTLVQSDCAERIMLDPSGACRVGYDECSVVRAPKARIHPRGVRMRLRGIRMCLRGGKMRLRAARLRIRRRRGDLPGARSMLRRWRRRIRKRRRRVRACAIIAHAATAVRRRPFYRTAARDHGERVKSRSRAADPSHAGAADAAMEDRMGRDFYPRPEGEILSFTLNFSQKISVSPGAYGLSVLQCTHYAATYEAFAGQHAIASNPMTATRGARAAKEEARVALEAETRLLARIVRAQPHVTGQMR